MRIAVIFITLATSCYGEELCSKDTIPDLNGAWVCNDKWLINTTQLPGEYGISTKWYIYYQLPKFYAVSRIRATPSCDEAYVLRLSAAVWDERFDKKKEDDVTKVPNSRWLAVEVPNFEFVDNNSAQEYSGFAKRAPYWRLEIDTSDTDESCLPKFMFFARAGIAAMQHFVMDLDLTTNTSTRLHSLPEHASIQNNCDQVTSVPSHVVTRYRLDTSFYRKYTSAYGIPIMSSNAVDDRALQRACYVVRFMLADRKDLRDHMYANKGRVAIIGRRETVPMVPEMRQYTWWTRRAAGGTFHNPVNVGAEENMLCESGDGYAKNQDIFMHEFAHGIHLIACHTAIQNFNTRLQQAFNSARSRGLWTNTYANTDNREYFAEGVQAFFEQQREGPRGGDGIQNHINTREELRGHDPTLYKIIDELFPCYNDYIPRCSDIGQARGLGQNLKMSCNGGTGVTIGPTPTTDPGSCVDDNESCSYWADQGECGKNPNYMLVNCKRSCKTCNTPTPTGVTTSKAATTSETTTTKPMKSSTSTETILTTTPASCVDEHTNCLYWAQVGECDKSPSYMKANCKESCKLCSGVTTSKASTTSKSTTSKQPETASTTRNTIPTTTPASCVDEHPNCLYWAQVGECDKNPIYMKNQCKESCKLCSGEGVCVDSNAMCVHWRQYCSYNQYVIKNCKKTCALC